MAQTPQAAVGRLVRVALDQHPGEVSQLVERAQVSDAVELLSRQSLARVVEVLSRLTPDRAARLLSDAPHEVSVRWVGGLSPNRAANLLARLDPEKRDLLLASMEPVSANELRLLVTYPADTAGYMMDPRVTTFRPETTVREVVRRLRTFRSRRIQDVFLVDEEGKLSAVVRLVDIVLAQPRTPLAELGHVPTAVVQAMASKTEVLEVLSTAVGSSVPVVDIDGHIVGVLRQEQLVNTAREAAASNLAAMVGAGRDERALAPPWMAVRMRLPWLLVNLGTAFAAATVVGFFESTIARFTALAVLLPVVAGQSGNTGAQALAVTMRGLALREVRLRQWGRIAIKEVFAGAINGVAVAAVTMLFVYLWSESLALCAVIGSSMILSMAIAALSGALVPVVLTALGLDPAQSSSIVLTTITDIAGFMSFLGIATSLSAYL